MMKHVWINDHKRGCTAVKYVKEKIWPNPWSVVVFFKYGSINHPYRQGNYRWLSTRCNSLDCDGLIAFREFETTKLLPKKHKPKRKK